MTAQYLDKMRLICMTHGECKFVTSPKNARYPGWLGYECVECQKEVPQMTENEEAYAFQGSKELDLFRENGDLVFQFEVFHRSEIEILVGNHVNKGDDCLFSFFNGVLTLRIKTLEPREAKPYPVKKAK